MIICTDYMIIYIPETLGILFFGSIVLEFEVRALFLLGRCCNT
jgi:hypothetical protein